MCVCVCVCVLLFMRKSESVIIGIVRDEYSILAYTFTLRQGKKK